MRSRGAGGRDFGEGDDVIGELADGTKHHCVVVTTRESEDDGVLECYIHFKDFDKRLDRWVPASQLRAYDPRLLASESRQAMRTRSSKRKHEAIVQLAEELDPQTAILERKREEETRVKNIEKIVLGRYEIDVWYFSPYPGEYGEQKMLYVNEFDLKYMMNRDTYIRYATLCPLRHPPGTRIYDDGTVAVYEIDGASDHKLYCQNLCLLGKLFLDHKTLFFDVEPFLFYVLTERSEAGDHIVGYFSKEKFNPDDYNIACILTLPPYQRRGYGRFLIEVAYELTRREGRTGTPERPLSDMGMVSFRAYWTDVLLAKLKQQRHAHPDGFSVRELSLETGIKSEDIISTLLTLRKMHKYFKDERLITLNAKALDQMVAARKRKKTYPFDPRKLVWEKPANLDSPSIYAAPARSAAAASAPAAAASSSSARRIATR